MDWLKQHGDTITILSVFAFCFWTLNEKISVVERDVAIIKTVLIMKNIMPTEVAHNQEKIDE